MDDTTETTTKETLSTVDQELALSKSSLQTIEAKWKKVLSTEKVESLKKQTSSLKQYYHDEIHQKNELLSILAQQFEHNEDQFQLATSRHVQALGELMKVHDRLLVNLEKEFHEYLRTLQEEKTIERHDIASQYKAEKELIQEEIQQMESREEKLEADALRDQQHSIEEIKNKKMEDINNLRFVYDSQVEDIEEQADLAKAEYVQKTSLRSESLQRLHEKHDGLSEEITMIQRQIENRQNELKQIQQVSRLRSSLTMEKSNEIFDRKESAITRYRDTKLKVEDQRSSHHEKLKDLTKKTHRLKSRYEDKLSLMIKISKLAKLAQRMERSGHEEAIEDDHYHREQGNSTCGDESSMEHNIEVMWKKYGKVALDMKGLDKEQEIWRKKNNNLKSKIKQYHDGTTVSNKIILGNNPLFVINGQVKPTIRQNDHLKTMTVIDANHVFSTVSQTSG